MKPYMPDAKKSYLTIKQLSSLYCADHSDDEIEQMPNLFATPRGCFKSWRTQGAMLTAF